MNYNIVGRLAFEPERTLAFGSISGTYAKVGSPLANPARVVVLQNTTDANVTFSFDGTNDTITLPTKTSVTLDVCANRTPQNSYFIASGTQIWVKGTVGSGAVFVSVFYGVGPIN